VSRDPFQTYAVKMLTPGNILTVNKPKIKLTTSQAGSILDVYSAAEFWNLPTTSVREKELTIEKLNDNILLLSLLLEGIIRVENKTYIKALVTFL
jgi:hypothetical protein